MRLVHKQILIAISIFAAIALIIFPIALTEIEYVRHKFDHKTPVKIGFGQRANQEFPLFPATAIMFRRHTPIMQTEKAYEYWLKHNPDKAKLMHEYQAFLSKENVGDIIPMRELLQGCVDNPLKPYLAFDVPPKNTWGNMVPTLKWFETNVSPKIGKVRLYHGYRNAEANVECGSHSGVHPANSAIDFVPLEEHDPAKIERIMCDIFRAKGKSANVGMGFYGVGLIHIDTKGFRSWGPDTKFRTSPCKIIQ